MAFYDRWLDRTLTRLGYVKASPLFTSVFAGEAPLGAGLGGPDLSQEQRERLAITSAWVYSDIRTIANEASAADIDVWQGHDRLEGHPVERLLERPNPHMAASWMLQYTVQWLLLRGEAYWLKVYDRGGELQELWPIPSSHIEPVPDAQDYIRAFKYTPANGRPPVHFAPREVVFFRFPNPFDYHRGLSPLSAYRLAVETDLAASEWNARTFRDDVTLRTLISVPAEMSAPNFARARAELESELVERKRRFLIVRSGDVTVAPLSISPKDMEFLASRTFTREEIDRVFGIPAGFWAKEATRANADAAKAVLIEQAVWPLLVLMAETITLQLVATDFGEGIACRFRDIRTEDRELLLKERLVHWRVKTINEARAELGLPPLDDPFIGETLVPLAPQVAARSDLDVFGAEGKSVTKAAQDDLRRWERIARRRVRAGESPAYDFESPYIPAEVKMQVLAGLASATTEEEVRAAFTPPFCM
ncbi:MAG: phage portal protein [Anaerolineae bacterium]